MSVSNVQVCHLWASGNKPRAKGFSVEFEGRSLYSWGTHYLLGYRLLPGVFLLNSERVSVSTGKHQSHAYRAAHGDIYRIDGLTTYRHELATLTRHAIDPRDPSKQADAERSAVAMISALAPRTDGLLEALADVASIPAGRARSIIDGATRKAAVTVEKSEKAKAASERAAAIRFAKIPFADVESAIADSVAKLKEGGYSADNALHHLQHWAKEANRQHRAASKAGLGDRTRAAVWRKVKAYRSAIVDHERKAGARDRLARFKQVRHGLEASLAGVAVMATDVAESGYVFGRFRSIEHNATVLLNYVTGSTSAALSSLARWANERNEWESAESARIANVKRADEIAAWRAGGRYVRFDSDHGGAAIRAVGVTRDASGDITGGTLETSHGASVPLVEAIRAFRFVKLCKERGAGWQRNGRTVRVGHYQIDRVTETGGMIAGCHRFAWPEIVSLAASLGVLWVRADDSAVVPSAHAA